VPALLASGDAARGLSKAFPVARAPQFFDTLRLHLIKLAAPSSKEDPHSS